MTRNMIRQYTQLVEFLGAALGPDYEVALHDFTNKNNSIIAIANGHVSGRTLGAPLTNVGLQMLADKSYENSNYRLNYSGKSAKGKVLRSSSMFIKDEVGRPVGMICINFDDSRFQEVQALLLRLCHPDEFVDHNISYEINPNQPLAIVSEETESFHNSPFSLADEVLAQVLGDSLSPERLTQEEKLWVVKELEEKGVFMLKGAVGYVSQKLCSSQASIYRYLSKVEKSKK